MSTNKIINIACAIDNYLRAYGKRVSGQNVARALRDSEDVRHIVSMHMDPEALHKFPQSYYLIAREIKNIRAKEIASEGIKI